MSNWSELKNTSRLKNIYDIRIEIIKSIREFFWLQGFLETDTPAAVRLASQEPYLNPVSIMVHDPHGKPEKFYLRTSPEYALKKLLAVGYEKVFEIGKCFRDFESFGGNHNPEFTMLEWYRAPGTYQEIIDDTEKLFKFVGEKLNKKSVTYKNKEVDISGIWDKKSMKEVWQNFIGVNLDNYLELTGMQDLAKTKGYTIDSADAYEDLFYKIFLNEIEPKLGNDRPVFVYDFPSQMTSLSRLSEQDSRYAERFELYIGGLELANAFGELTDAKIQKDKLEEDVAKRRALGKETWPIDPDFISALQSGIASAGGIAMGVDRMVLLFTGAKDLNETIFQSVKDQL
jgi:lysyl-tRNA synthetase class 2